MFLEKDEDDNWSLRINCGNVTIADYILDDNINNNIISVIESEGYTEEQTILLEFVYDASIAGTNKTYKMVKNALDEITSRYNYLYYTETDLAPRWEGEADE